MISKTRESGRTDLLVRMAPELKGRIEEAARRERMTRNDWVLNAIKAILKVQELHAQTKTEIKAVWQRQLAKFEELLAALAEQQKLGDVANLSGRDRSKLEAMADAQLEKWRLEELRYGTSNPKNKLERLCKEHQDLTEEARCIRDEETNRKMIEQMERRYFPAGWDEEEVSDDWDEEQFSNEEEFPGYWNEKE